MIKYYRPKPKPIFLTKEGLEETKSEFERLTKYRKEVIERLQTARAMGDLSENAAYSAAKREQRDTDRRLRHLTKLIRRGVVKEPKNKEFVGFGSTVSVNNGTKTLTFSIVSGYESDPSKQKLSLYSPLGKALKGKKAGDKVIVKSPIGSLTYKIISIT